MLRFDEPTASRSSELAAPGVSLVPAVVAAPAPVDMTVEDPALTPFLDAIIRRLVPLPADLHHDVRAELRTHLESLIAAHEELGATREAAVLAAIRQFGDSKRIARRFRQAWRQTRSYERPWAAMRMASLTFSAALLITCVALGTLGPVFAHANLQGVELVPGIDNHIIGAGFVLGMPVLAGAYVGWRVPRRAAFGTFCALAALACVTLAFFMGSESTTGIGAWDIFCGICPLFTIVLMPIGWLSAVVASTVRVYYAESLRRRWQAWRRTEGLGAQQSAMRHALATFGVAMAVMLGVSAAIYNGFYFSATRPNVAAIGVILTFAFGLPILGGIRVGLRSPRYAAVGAFVALLALTAFTLPLGHWSGVAMPCHSRLVWIVAFLCGGIGPLFLLWLPLGTLTTAFTAWARTRRRKRLALSNVSKVGELGTLG